MTITRADVEWMQAAFPGTIAELCRTWLAVDDAPTAETVSHFTDLVGFQCASYIPAGTYKLVCIDTPTGGREHNKP